ncbi:hypothetical protein BIY27_12270 [Gibbsiella quercinecans]|uniref:hypothetical protein n=1 Tax=Gibbsiella quercinecans TaxID=929813 RepID=UPI000EF1D337|nr:hypothetical protein [Gibbsiella quercinecans]RLM11850.1 hypothetical protein BIY27_12270 [Gibbsiella quercinecans]
MMVIVVVMAVAISFRISGGDKVATEQQLLRIVRETPCAEEAFRDALTPNVGLTSDPNDTPEPLTINKAYELASKCKERERKVSDSNETNKIREKQLESLNSISQ